MKDTKYGYGGKRKGSKWNTAESSGGFERKQAGGQMNRQQKVQFEITTNYI